MKKLIVDRRKQTIYERDFSRDEIKVIKTEFLENGRIAFYLE